MKHVYYLGRERNDCSVSAVAMATGQAYERSYAEHEAQGRRRRGRTKLSASLAAVERLGYRAEPVDVGRWRTLRDVVENELPPRGAYLVMVRGHFLSVVDGVVYDFKPSPTRRVLRVYRVEPIARPAPVKLRISVKLVQLELQLEAA